MKRCLGPDFVFKNSPYPHVLLNSITQAIISRLFIALHPSSLPEIQHVLEVVKK